MVGTLVPSDAFRGEPCWCESWPGTGVRYLDVKQSSQRCRTANCPRGSGVTPLMAGNARIIYTHTDEAPLLATYSFLPIVQAYAGKAGVEVETRDISVAARILAQFGHADDALAELGELAKTPEANIIKLPNISASIPQLKAAIKELQDAGYDVPDYEDASDAYDTVKGSAVNPVLREGNSDRRAPASVKAFARKHPHSMGAWSKDSKSHVSTMSDGDFRSTEQSVTVPRDDTLRIEHVAADGRTTVLKDGIDVLEGEIVDAAVMRRR